MKVYAVIITVLFLVLAAVTALIVTGTMDIKKKNEPAPEITTAAPEPVTTAPAEKRPETPDGFAEDNAITLPLMQTDFDGVYYTMDFDTGEVVFYEAADGAFTVLPEAGNFDVKVTCSAQELPAQIHYIERDGRTYGCGLCTNKIYPDVMYYDYAFFRLTDMFEAYRDTQGVNYASRGAKLLLLDVEKSRFYSDEKVYSEAFILNKDHSVKLFLSNDQRVEGRDGREKPDYKMFTDATLGQNSTRNVLFLSSRFYEDYAKVGKTDIFTSGGSGTNIDNVRLIPNVKGLYFWRQNDAVLYFADNGDGSFSLMRKRGEAKAETVETFSGDLTVDYIVRGAWIMNRHTGDVKNVLGGEPLNVSFAGTPAGFTADLFAISSDGRYCAVRGVGADKKVGFVAADTQTGKAQAFTDDIFTQVAALRVQNDGEVIVSVADAISPGSFYQITVNIGE